MSDILFNAVKSRIYREIQNALQSLSSRSRDYYESDRMDFETIKAIRKLFNETTTLSDFLIIYEQVKKNVPEVGNSAMSLAIDLAILDVTYKFDSIVDTPQ